MNTVRKHSDSQIYRMHQCLPRGNIWWKGKLWSRGLTVHTATFKTDQQGPSVWLGELCPMFGCDLNVRQVWGGWTCVYQWLSPFAVLEILTQHFNWVSSHIK